MQYSCGDCGAFFNAGQSEPAITPGTYCPHCHSYQVRPYRDQPGGIGDESNDMLHGLKAMPQDGQDDMSGNPLQEGFMGDYKNRDVRDESFSSAVRSTVSLFETPQFETEQIIAPPDLYRHALETEAAHKTGIQLPEGITDNLHAALGNLGAWVENPYENGKLRPYSNYYKTIRPKFMTPGALRIGVADPTMAEIINHVAQTDDLSPLYQYRGRQSSVKTTMFLAPEGLALLDGVAGSGAAEAASAAGATSAASSASGVGGAMKKLLGGPIGTGLNLMDDTLGLGGGGSDSGQGSLVNDASFYARIANDEDDAYPSVHGEIPKQEDGDYNQKDDGNSHEWQRDISVNGVGGTDHSPSFDPAGPAFTRFVMIAPLLLQYLESGEDASQDPLIKALHESLEAEIPGYLDHGDENAGHQLLMILKGGNPDGEDAEPSHDEGEHNEAEHNEPNHGDENAGGMHESKTVSLFVDAHDGGDFLPDLIATPPPALRGFRTADMMPSAMPGGMPPSGMLPPSPMSGPPAMPATPPTAPSPDDSQGPVTDEQQAWFANWLQEQGRSEEVSKMIANPQLYAKEFALARNRSVPPESPDQNAGFSANPPPPAQEEAPPEATMPMPGMSQMMAAVKKYTADSIASKCPNCGSHTTELVDGETGKSHCHGCNTFFTTPDVTADNVHPGQSTASIHEAFIPEGEGVQGVPIADQVHQRDLRKEQDSSGHTWLDTDGAPLRVGQQYEMYSQKFDIPDVIRIEAVKPSSIIYTLTGEFGPEHSAELTREEADIEGVSFKSTIQDGEVDGDDDSLEENNDDNTGYRGTPERTDASAPTGLVASTNSRLDWLMKGLPRTAGANFTPMEQRELIEEGGLARNAELLSLQGTHYLEADEDSFLFGI